MSEDPKMFVKYRGDTPVKYYYGTSYAPLAFGDEGYSTPEEAMLAYEREQEKEHG